MDSLLFVPADGEADVVLRQHLAVVDAVRKVRIRRVVFLSGLDSDADSPFCYARTNAMTEVALRGAAQEVVAVRAGLFLEFAHTLLGAEREVTLPAGAVLARFLATPRADVAGALVDAVLEAAPPSARTVTGEVVSFAGLARAQGLQVVPVTLDAYAAALVAAGTPTWWVHAFSTLMTSVQEGRFLPRDREPR